MLLLVGAVQILLLQMIWAFANQRIAIIGGGIGGASCAHFLRKAFQENISITVFERDVIGGRLATINVGGDEYESGGSVIHPRNKYMADFTQLLGLQQRKPVASLWGIYNGEKFVFEDSEWAFITLSRLYWRYGWDIFRLNTFVSSLLDEFSTIYKHQEEGVAYTSVTSLLDSMSSKFPNMTQQPLQSFMKKSGFSDKFIDELVQAVTLVNYGQTVDVNAFVGAVSLAGSESGLWSIQGGNKQVPSGLLAMSDAAIINAEVSAVTLLDDSMFEIAYRQADYNIVERQQFDAVVVAAPLMEGHTMLQFNNFSKEFDKYFKMYHRTVSTFVQGKIKPSAFSSTSVPDAVLTNDNSFIVNSVGRTFPVTGKTESTQKVYKIFSKLPLTKEQIDSLFDDVKLVKVKDWMAYPHYSPPETIPPFMLYPNLYYTNAIEWAASAMEMSAISGRNVALLISNTWKNKIDLIDPNQRLYKDEL